jgi:putative nucleotidyltransferase with HDIG domain
VSEPGTFLNYFAQALAVMTLYPDGHPSRERAIDAAFQALEGLSEDGQPSFTFLENEVVYGRERLRDFREWDWGSRLVAAGIQRLEFERRVSRDEFDSFLQEILARLTLSAIDTSENRQMRPIGIRFGAVGLQGETERPVEPPSTTLDITLGEEVETLRWMQDQVQIRGAIPLIEAETVVRSLAVAMHGDRRMVLPLLQLKEFDQYTTTHSLNVAVLTMGLAEKLGCTAREVREYGVAGLLHDIGKIRIPVEVLTKPGKLSDEERVIINRHPVDGARIIMQSDDALDVAAVVAYEHHIMLNGGGYPSMHYNRPCTLASRLVHVCDVFDALRTKRPYRDAWESEKVLAYLVERAGTEFDPDLVSVFVRMLREGEAQVSDVTEARPAADAANTALGAQVAAGTEAAIATKHQPGPPTTNREPPTTN